MYNLRVDFILPDKKTCVCCIDQEFEKFKDVNDMLFQNKDYWNDDAYDFGYFNVLVYRDSDLIYSKAKGDLL